jgi:hypothetical protein
MEDDKGGVASFDSSIPFQVPARLFLSNSEKAEALTDSFEAQFQPVPDPLEPAVTEMISGAMQAYRYS